MNTIFAEYSGVVTTPEPSRERRTLRVGVLLDSTRVSRWVEAVLDELDRTDFINTFIIVLEHDSSPPQSVWQELIANPPWALFALWTRWDYRHWRRRQEDAFESVDLASRPRTLRVPHGDALQPIRNCALDVIVNFSSVEDTTWAAGARFGTWSFEQGGTEYRPLLPRFQEMVEGKQVTNSIRLRISASNRRDVISSAPAHVDAVSLFRFQNAACWKLPRFLVRQLAHLHRAGTQPFDRSENDMWLSAPRAKAERLGSQLSENAAMARFLASWAWRGLRARCLRERWFIAYRDKRNPGGARVIMPPPDRAYADPFVFGDQGRNYIFFEDYRHPAGKAVISFVEIDENGAYSSPHPVLECSYHLSYPCVFKLDSNIYLLPETSDSQRIEIYRAEEFPCRWVRERVLLDDIAVVDATPFRHAGKWWLFAGRRGGNDQLLLFHADSLLGPWMPHPENPIVSDVRRARPAGHLFYENGKLIRPAQDCSRTYGHSVVFNHVQKLTTEEYAESPIAHIPPSWFPGNRGTHTWNENPALQVVDGRVAIAAPLAWYGAFRWPSRFWVAFASMLGVAR